MKLAILSPTNVDFLATEFRKSDFETYTASYGQVVVEAVNPDSGLYGFAPETIVLFYDAADIFGNRLIRPFEDTEPDDQIALGEIESTINAITSNLPGARIIVNTIPVPANNGIGRLEYDTDQGLREAQHEHNSAIATLANEHAQVLIYDYSALAESHGLSTWYDERMWFLARSRLARESIAALTTDIADFLVTASTPRAKVIVVDLDNTCWGGVIGDDGIGGIVIGTEGPGLAFASFQRALLNFRDQGVLLAIASKNELSVVEEVFDSHSGMILTKDDITSWQVNWGDKALSIQQIADDLDLGVDSLVFFDDNPAERLRVSEAHPEVTVIDVPSDSAEYVAALFGCRDLATLSLTDEDLVRPNQYKARSNRAISSNRFTDVEEFLESLEMEVEISENLEIALPRIAQLTQKTNQFNLRTQRYSEADLAKMIAEESHRVFWLRLTDRFGDEGIVIVAIVETGPEWFLDTFLMSCRVLNRGVEQSMIKHLKSEAQTAGVRELRAEYIESGRNDMVKNLLPSMGFTESGDHWLVSTSTDGPVGPIELNLTAK
jgi:FkbH-like protein